MVLAADGWPGVARRRLGDARHGRRPHAARWRPTASPTAGSTRATPARAGRHLPAGLLAPARSSRRRPRLGAALMFCLGVDAEPAVPGALPARPRSSSSATRTRSASPGCRTGSSGFTDGIAAAGGWIAVRGALRPARLRAVVRAHRVDRRLRPDLRVPGRGVRPRARGCTRFPRASASAAALTWRKRLPRAHRRRLRRARRG